MGKNVVCINMRFLDQPVTGVQRYSAELVNELLSDTYVSDDNQKILFEEYYAHKPISQQKISGDDTLWGNLWEQFILPTKLHGNLLFSPANIGPFFCKHQVVTIHDTSVFAYPDAYTWTFRLKYQVLLQRIARIADHIITVSEFSKREIQKWLNISADRISVTYEGREHMERIDPDPSILEKLRLKKKPFFVVIGSNSPHKNSQLVIAANSLMDHAKFEIVQIGGDFSSVFQTATIDLPANIKKAGYVSDQELKALYQNAAGMIFPSFYEGFGLPLVEAMTCGCPVICSAIPSSIEVCGDAVKYFDPNKPDELADILEGHLNNPLGLTELAKKGGVRSQEYSWKKTAMETMKVLGCYL